MAWRADRGQRHRGDQRRQWRQHHGADQQERVRARRWPCGCRRLPVPPARCRRQGSGENWYLRSNGETGETGEPTETTPTTEPADPPVTTYRAEAALYAALPSQLRQSNLAMIGNLHQRVGDDDPRSGYIGHPIGHPCRSRSSGMGPRADHRCRRQPGRHGVAQEQGPVDRLQAGTDLLATQDWRAGLYVGQLDGNVSVNGFVGGIANAGAGATICTTSIWASTARMPGTAASTPTPCCSWAVTAHGDASVQFRGRDQGDSLLASLELGRAFPLGGSA
jgi:hypothetical protein